MNCNAMWKFGNACISVKRRISSGQNLPVPMPEDKEANKEMRENLEMGMKRKRKEELEAEGDKEPLDFRYSTIGLELFKASRGARQQPRKPTYGESGYSQPNNLPHSG